MRRWVFYLGIALFTLAVAVAVQFFLQPYLADSQKNPVASSPADVGGPFALVDHRGKSVTDADFRGRYMLVFFGYTFCPDVCPTDLQVIGDAMEMLGDKSENVQPIFITVDPERDTAAVLAEYVVNFHPRLLGLTGTKEQIAEAAKAYRAVYFKAETKTAQSKTNTGAQNAGAESDGYYLMNHTAITYLMGPDGKFVTHFSHGTTAETMAEELRRVVN